MLSSQSILLIGKPCSQNRRRQTSVLAQLTRTGALELACRPCKRACALDQPRSAAPGDRPAPGSWAALVTHDTRDMSRAPSRGTVPRRGGAGAPAAGGAGGAPLRADPCTGNHTVPRVMTPCRPALDSPAEVSFPDCCFTSIGAGFLQLIQSRVSDEKNAFSTKQVGDLLTNMSLFQLIHPDDVEVCALPQLPNSSQCPFTPP